MNELTLKSKAEKIAESIIAGMESWVAAGTELVSLLDAGVTLEEVHGMMPKTVPFSILRTFEKFGRRLLLPEVYIAEYPAAGFMKKLSVAQQQQCLEKPVALLTIGENGAETLMCDVRDMTAAQCRQVFDGGAVRSLAQQRAWIESERSRLSMMELVRSAKSDDPFVVRGSKVLVRRDTELTRKQLHLILAQMDQ